MNSQPLRNTPDDKLPTVNRTVNPAHGGFALGAAMVALMVAVPAGPVAAAPVPFGRIHLDYAVHDSDVTELDNATYLRRARIGLKGEYEEVWEYKLEMDLAENDVVAKDVYLRHTSIGPGALTIGQKKVPFSLEELTSSNDITFIERASPNVFSLAYRTGLQWDTAGDRYTFAVMGFGQPIGEDTSGGDEGMGIGARATYAPMQSEGNVVHLGVAAMNYEPVSSNTTEMRFRQRPESRPDGTRLVDTGTIADVDTATGYGLEAAWVSGPFSLQSEWMGTSVARDVGEDVDFSGWYIFGSYFLTGESRRYSNGAFKGPKIANASRGAWEVALRYSNLDLNDGAITGGEMKNTTLGINWYADSNVRFMLNYIAVETEDAGGEDNPNIIVARGQVSF